MTNSRTTRKALVSSALAVLMCMAMLIGTTFAWFTDTASTAVNKIQSGNLNVELLDKDGVALAEDAKLTWVKADGHTEEAVLWEPNCTYDLDQFQIKNAGNLALKYKVVLKATDITKKGDKSLLDVIEWTVKVDDETIEENVLFDELGADNGIAIIDGEKLLADKTVKISVTGHMKSDAGNEYQDLSIDGFGITVYAAQVNEEYDSTSNTYDIQATYDSSAPKTPLVVKVGTAAELQAALNVFSAAGGTNVVELTQDFDLGTTTWGSVHIDGYSGEADVTIKGNGHTIKNLSAPLFEGGFAGKGTLTIKDLTIDNPNISLSSMMGVGAFFGSADNMNGITLDNCHVTGGSIVNTSNRTNYGYAGGLIGYSSTPVTITNCTVNGCTITGTSSAGGLIGHLNGQASTISGTVTNCTITGESRADKTGIILGTANSAGITITTGTCSGNKAGATPSELTNLVGRFVSSGNTLNVNGHTYTDNGSNIKNTSYTSNLLN